MFSLNQFGILKRRIERTSLSLLLNVPRQMFLFRGVELTV